MTELTGKVAQIVSDREVILNRGAAHGVKPGMYFKVLDPSAIGVKDPDSGEVLGSLSRIKIVVRAAEVADSLTVAETFRKEEVNVGGTGANILGGLMTPPRWVERVETLRRGEDAPSPLVESESIVRIGDPFEVASEVEVRSARSVSLWREPRPGEQLDDAEVQPSIE